MKGLILFYFVVGFRLVFFLFWVLEVNKLGFFYFRGMFGDFVEIL